MIGLERNVNTIIYQQTMKRDHYTPLEEFEEFVDGCKEELEQMLFENGQIDKDGEELREFRILPLEMELTPGDNLLVQLKAVLTKD